MQTSLYFKPDPILILISGFRYLNSKSIKDFKHVESQRIEVISFLTLL